VSIFLTLVECCGECSWGRPLVVSGAAPFLFLLLAGQDLPALVCVASWSSVCVGGPGLGGAAHSTIVLLQISHVLVIFVRVPPVGPLFIRVNAVMTYWC
jgi:hypothetical protein